MGGLLAGWEGACERSGAMRFIDINLRAVGQVMLQDNPVTGLLFVIAVCWGSYAAGAPQIGLGGIVAVVVATLVAMWLRVEPASLRAGLYGYNAYLVGLALPTFLAGGPLLWIYIVLGAAVSVLVVLGTSNVIKPWGISALTAPFVLVTWLLLLATYAFSGIEGAMAYGAVVTPIDPAYANPLRPVEFLQGVLFSISQVFLKGDALSALLIVAGLAVNSIAATALSLVRGWVRGAMPPKG